MLTRRPYRGPEDLPALHEVARAVWAHDAPRALPHVGDVTWGLYQHEDEVASPKAVELFERDGVPVAFAFAWLPQTLQPAVHPDHRDDEVYDALLGWFEGAAGEVDGGLDVQLLESDAPLLAALARHGYAPHPEGAAMEHRVRSLAEPVEVPTLPEGYRVRSVEGEADLERRVEVHRAAWAPSRFTLPGYRRLRTLPPYREELDVVVEAPDGSFAASALGWLDEANGVGELEPVGTDPAHRRRGLAGAACLEVARRLRGLGASTAVVYAVEGSPAGSLYGSLGFAQVDRHVEWRRPA